MGTETINIVIAESGAEQASSGIQAIGAAAAAADATLSELLARAGVASSAMTTITGASGSASAALAQMAAGATNASTALLGTGSSATTAGSRLVAVGASSEEAAVGMGVAGTAGTALALSMREAATAAAAAALAETEVGAAGARAAVGVASVGNAATASGAKMAHLGEESGLLQNKMERLELTFIALGVALGAKELIDITDSFANMSNQLDRITISAADYANKQEDIFRIAQLSHQPFEALTSVYVNMSMALKGMNADRVSRAIQTLAQAATVSGKSVAETSSALDRLGISLRQGEINGRGFLQFLVQMPEVGEKVAANLGFIGTQGFARFVKAANEGAISNEMFVKALNEIGPAFDKEAAHMEVTISKAFTNVRNAFLGYIGYSDETVGASRRVADAILGMARHIEVVVGVIATLTIAIAAYGIAVGTAALASGVLAFSFAAIVAIVAAAAAALFFFGNMVKVTADGSVTAFSLVWGAIKTVISIIGELVKWFTTTENGAITLYAALSVLAVVLGKLAFEQATAALIKFGTFLLAQITTVGLTVIALAALVAEYVAVRYATVALAYGIDAANADLKQMTDNVVKLGRSIKTEFTANITDTQGPLAKLQEDLKHTGDQADAATVSILRYGKEGGGAFKALGAAGSAASVNIVNAAAIGSRGIAGLAATASKTKDSVSLDLNKMAKSADQSMTEMAGSTKKVGAAFDELGREMTKGANEVLNAMGEYVQAESQWAANSGASFNQISKNATSSAGALSSMGAAPQGYSAPSSQGFSDGWGISDVSRGSGAGISSLSQSFSRFATGGGFEVGGHGGTDSQLIQFLATPGERITVETPGQQAAGRQGAGSYGTGGNTTVNMTVVTQDANSFRENESQIVLRLQNRLKTVQGKLGGT